MFQSGVTALLNNATGVDVVFPTTFDEVPDTVLCVVQNVSADGTKYIIVANVMTKSTTGFTAAFDAALTSDNYELAWLAGSSYDVVDLVSMLNGRKLTSFPNAATMRLPFKIPMMAMTPVPHVELLTPATFFSAVIRRAANVPAGPLDGTRDALEITADDNWLYVGLSSLWGRIPIESGASWSGQAFYRPFREGAAAITPVSGQVAYDITFATPFSSGVVPEIQATPRNTLTGPSADADKEILAYQVVASSLSGFTIAFSSPPTAANLVVYYMARQLA